MNKTTVVFKHIKPSIIAIVVFIFLLLATFCYTNYKQGLWEKDIRANMLDVLIGKKSKLEKALYSRIYYTRGVAAFVALKPNITTEEFYDLAKEFIKNDTVISTMSLSKNCVISAIYPYKGHEAAIGLDLLKHPERKDIVEKTIETHQTFVAGPVELVEGGIAFISYTPIFDKASKDTNLFWGVTDIVIKQQGLFNEAHFISSENGFEYALRGYNGMGNEGAIFWGNASVFDKNPVTIPIDLPIGTWVLAGIPQKGWDHYTNQDKAISFILLFSSFIISILFWLFAKALYKISQNEKNLKAIFGSLDNLIVEYDSNGEYLKIAPTNDSILVRPRNELLGKKLHEIFDREKADILLNAIRECLETKKLVVIEYPLEINGTESWFNARISYKSANSVIFNAFDITERKINEEIIHQSESRLKELNVMKDKFFSIIAHDLRNPVGHLKVTSEFVLDEFDTMDSVQLKKLLESMKNSSSNLQLLLEDLLEWSLSQSENLIVKKQEIFISDLFINIIKQFEATTHQKEIQLSNEIAPNVKVIADPDLTAIVLRNLISNAIKYTLKGGEIRVSSDNFMLDKEQFLKINIVDNGTGMNNETLTSLFQIDKAASTPGTENEKGTGLGLLFCKELIEKQGGKIFVTSVLGQGSTFSFILPLEADWV